MKSALRPAPGSITPSTRRSHAASKSTPGMSVRISKPRGARPKRKKVLRSVKSSGRMPWSGAPNSASAAYVARAFVGSAFIKTSMSLVKRGCAWKLTAYPPTMRYLTPWVWKADKRSLYSWYIWLDLPTLEGVCSPDHFLNRVHALMHRATLPVPVLVGLGFLVAGVPANGRVHAFVCSIEQVSRQTHKAALAEVVRPLTGRVLDCWI